MANLRHWILEEAEGEAIEAVVIGEAHSCVNTDIPNYAGQPRNKVLSWQEAIPWLDYTFNDSYGIPRCNAVYAWTEDKVIFISQYDGLVDICSVPRNPIECEPVMPGG